MSVYTKWVTKAHKTLLWHVVLVTIAACLVHVTFTLADKEVIEMDASQKAHQKLLFTRLKREPAPEEHNMDHNMAEGTEHDSNENEESTEPEGEGDDKGGKGEGVSLGQILGLVFIICCIFYCIGIGYKIFKICKGTYVEEEPVFLKYK